MEKDEKAEALEQLLGGDPGSFCASWLEAIEQAGDDERDWRETEAEEAMLAYKGDPKSDSAAFNIFHSNIETLVPALYNSTPIPDVRRRFNDDDPVAAQTASILERALSFSTDDYDFDDVMKNVVKDMAIVDRGIARIKYQPTFGADDQTVLYEEVRCEYVPWKTFRRGPAVQWAKVPWIAFAHFLDRNEVAKLMAREANVLGYAQDQQMDILRELKFCYSAASSGDKSERNDGKELPKFGRREMVWEVWDRDTKQVIWLSQDYRDMPLAIMDDPLRLKDFFPTPRPAMVLTSTESLCPVTSYRIYCKLIRQLNDISERIDALVDQIRVRGGYVGTQAEIEQIAKADDGELVPLNNLEGFVTNGGDVNKAVFWWPLEMIYKALEVLVAQREIVKQTIYEVTGLSDILRGATDANETATAQQIKQQWGSVRVQSHQKEVERYARDLFRLKAEVMCKHFDIQTLILITGVKLPTQEDKQRAQELKAIGEEMFAQYQQAAQQAQQQGLPPPEPPVPEDEVKQMQEQVEEILGKPTIEEVDQLRRDDRVLKYRVDIESNSTVRADLTRNQEQMKAFLDGTAAYIQSVGPMVQQIPSFGKPAVRIYASFARHFNLGKQAEDALDEFSESIAKNGIDGPPPDPTVQAEADLKAAQAEKTRAETQVIPQQLALETAKSRAEVVFKARQAENADAREATRFELDRRRASTDHMAREREFGLKGRELDERGQLDRDRLDMDRENAQAQLAETRAARQSGERMEQLRLRDGIKARREGFAVQAAAVQGGGLPQFEDQDLGDDMLTDEERARMEQTNALMQQVVTSLESMAQAQMASTQAMAQALEGLTRAITAPKEVVRDEAGRAIGVRPLMDSNQEVNDV